LISTSRFVAQQTGQIDRPRAGQLRFSFRFWQRGQAITQALHTPETAAIVGNFLRSRVHGDEIVSIGRQCGEKSPL